MVERRATLFRLFHRGGDATCAGTGTLFAHEAAHAYASYRPGHTKSTGEGAGATFRQRTRIRASLRASLPGSGSKTAQRNTIPQGKSLYHLSQTLRGGAAYC